MKTATVYSVYVSNIGCVHTSSEYDTARRERAARREFNAWASACRMKYGRAAGESVALMADDEIIKEFTGRIEKTSNL